MSDLIDREQALACFEGWDDGMEWHDATELPAYDRLQKLPIVTEAEDCISRQAALNSPVTMVSEGLDWIPAFHIKDLPPAQPEKQWIPCSDRMPEYDKPVLLSTAWCKTEIGFWTQRGWMIVACSYREFEQSAVTAWMPLPEPYRRGGENE